MIPKFTETAIAAGETLSPGVELTSGRPPHGIFCFNGDAYQAQDVLAIRKVDDDEITIQLRGIQEYESYVFNTEKERDDAWEKGLVEWCEAMLASKGLG